MASPVIASSNNTAFAVATNTVITKPTGLAAGDLMVAVIGFFGANEAFSDPSGWTILAKDENSSGGLAVYYKVADSSDAAASNFTFSKDAGTARIGGALYRVTGFASSNIIADSENTYDAGEDTSMSETCAIDPDSGESLLFCIFAPAGFTLGATYTVSGYATTPTTTLTEQHDFGFRDGASDGMTIAVATAPYTGTTQITSYSATASEDPDNVKQVIFAINAPQSATADVGHLSVSPTLFGVTSSNTATATVSHLSITPTLNGVEAVDSSDTTQWSNQSKNTSTWTNTDKSN